MFGMSLDYFKNSSLIKGLKWKWDSQNRSPKWNTCDIIYFSCTVSWSFWKDYKHLNLVFSIDLREACLRYHFLLVWNKKGFFLIHHQKYHFLPATYSLTQSSTLFFFLALITTYHHILHLSVYYVFPTSM